MSLENHDCWKSDYARDFVIGIHDRPACVTCKDPCAPIYRKNRCQHCYRLDLKVCNLEKKIKQFQNEGKKAFFDYELELSIAKAMIKDAEREGSRYGDIYSRALDGIDLEYEFAFLNVFQSDKIKQIVCSALDEARKSAGLLIFAYVIMPDHVHLITGSSREISETLRYTNGITAKRVIDYLKDNNYESSLAKLRI